MRRESNRNIFQPRARLLIQLGDTLIKNENIALLELIKNSYDADAREVKVKLNLTKDKKNSSIDIIDNGEGMDIDIVENVWLEPGSDYKLQKFKNRERSSKYKRLPIGEKGIGRFGVHKLGYGIELVSRRKKSEEVVVRIDWRKFEQKKYLKDAEIEVFERTPEYFIGSRTGTRITITDLRTEWDKKMVRELYKSIFNLNSPFKKTGNFFVELDVSEKSFIQRLPRWDDIHQFALWHIQCELDGSSIRNFIYEFTPWHSMYGVIGRIVSIDDPFIQKNIDLVVPSRETPKKEIELDLNRNFGTVDSPKTIGPVKIEAYIFDRARKTLNLYDQQGTALLKEYLDEQGGISVYRDNIKINYYGEKGNDWLNLDLRRVNIPTKRISNNLILGTVDLSLENSTALIEKTNREGFIENEAFGDFSAAVLYVLHLVEVLRDADKDKIRESLEPSQAEEPVLYNLRELKSLVEDKINDKSIRVQINKHIEKIESDYNSINETLLTSAGAGLTLAVGVHEIQKVIAELNYIVNQEQIPHKVLDLVKHLGDLIENYSDLLRQSKKQSEGVSKLISGALFNISYRIKGHDIQIVNRCETRPAVEVIISKRLILGSIVNIIDNSIYWLERKRKQLSKEERTFEKKIYLDYVLDHDTDLVEIIIADNGPGFGLPIHKIVKPFISDKPNGMGLGLHIVKEVMKVLDGQLYFPESGEYNIPEEFDGGAIVVLKIKMN